MAEIVVVTPVLNRPANAARVYASLKASGADARMLFVCTPGDDAEIEACRKTGADVLVVPFSRENGDWARKINTALQHTDEPHLFLGADDLHYHPGWDREALVTGKRTGCGVIGTNDMGNAYVMRGRLATHALISREYAEQYGTIDERGKILHEGYYHNWVDWELTETAMSRGQFFFARRSRVEHLHPLWKKAEMDPTYELALDRDKIKSDQELLHTRRQLWAADLRRKPRRRTQRRGR